MQTYPMRTTYVVSVRGRRRASIQTLPGSTELATAELVDRYVADVRASIGVNDPAAANSITVTITEEPDHAMQAADWLDARAA